MKPSLHIDSRHSVQRELQPSSVQEVKSKRLQMKRVSGSWPSNNLPKTLLPLEKGLRTSLSLRSTLRVGVFWWKLILIKQDF